MSKENIKKKEIKSEQLDNVTGGYFVAGVGGSDGTSGESSVPVSVTVYHVCQSCKHSWEANHTDTTCPSCGGTSIKTFVS